VLSRGKVIVDAGVYRGRKSDGQFVKRALSQNLI
jgi:dihydropyrimidinase